MSNAVGRPHRRQRTLIGTSDLIGALVKRSNVYEEKHILSSNADTSEATCCYVVKKRRHCKDKAEIHLRDQADGRIATEQIKTPAQSPHLPLSPSRQQSTVNPGKLLSGADKSPDETGFGRALV